jgi:hypothetical protein
MGLGERGRKEMYLPAMASCLMKKFILDFRLLLTRRATKTAEFPRTIIVNRTQSTDNCSAWNNNQLLNTLT